VALQRNDSCILSSTNSPVCYVPFLWQRPITLFQDFYVRNSSQIRTKRSSVFCGVRILVTSCHNGLLIPVHKPLPETLGAGYVPEFRIFRILEWQCVTHTACCVTYPRGLRHTNPYFHSQTYENSHLVG